MSGMTGTGLKKCIPTNRSRRGAATASARRWMAIDEVFEAKIACAGASSSSSRQSAVLTAMSSNTASMTRSALGHRGGVGGGLDPGERRVALLGRQASLRDRPIQVARDPVAARLGTGQVRLVERDRQSDRGVDLGDPVAHQAGARDEHPLDRAWHGGMVAGRMGHVPP